MSLRYACWLWLALNACAQMAAAEASDLDRLTLPAGFEIHWVTQSTPNARQLAQSASGVLFAGSRRAGKVYAVINSKPGDPAEQVIVVASGLNMPSGIAFRGDDLYVGAVDRVLRYRGIGADPQTPIEPEVITRSLPDKRHHGWKYLSFGPDGYLYLTVGAPCNICLSEDPRFASILRMDPDTGQTQIVARGVRNSVGLAWQPATGELWFSDNGRDNLGDDIPSDEINRISQPGQHFGYPYFHAGDIPDPEFGTDKQADAFTPPVIRVQAHSAVTGMTFYEATGQTAQFPERFNHALFVAEHGSWNRSKKVGYQVSVALFDSDKPNQPIAYQTFVSGWLNAEKVWGRPNDVLVARDGSLLISDDKVGAIYRVRISRSTETAAAAGVAHQAAAP